jgi:penicillin amidase
MLSKIKREEFLDHSEILDELENWDGNHDLKSTAPTLFYKWTYHTLRLAMEDELGKDAFAAYLGTFMMIRSTKHFLNHEENPWWDNRATEKIETREEIIQTALVLSLEELTKQHGKDAQNWDWNKSIVAVHPHPLGAKKPLDKIFNVSTDPVPANEQSVNKLAFRMNGEGIYKVTSGPAMRIILDFEDVEKSVSVLPTGQSGNRFSKHYADQAKLYAKGKYRPQLMNESTIRDKAKNILILSPK